MKITQLKYFITTIEAGSLKKAAEELNVTHAALSISLTSLEKEMNRQLLIRNHAGCLPTEDGKTVYAIAKKIETNMNKLEDIKDNCKHDSRISITTSSHSLLNILYRINFDFSNQYVDAEIQLQENSTLNLESFKYSNADFFFYLSHSRLDNSGNNYLLFSSPYVFCLSKQHPLAYLKQLSFSDIVDRYPLLLFCDQDIVPSELQIPAIYEHYRSFDTIRTLLNDNQCIALIPKIFINHKFYMFNQNLLSVSITDFKTKLRGYLLHNPNKILSQLQKDYVDYLLRQLK